MDRKIKDISVIIPVFNTEKYLKQCIESLENQNSNLEIIIVDDGSTDGSGVIADELGQKDPRIKVIHQEHKGLSAARNRGIEEAEGEYIFFLDSDDRIKEHSLDHLYAEATKHHADIIMGNVIFCYPDGVEINPYNNIAKHIIGTPLTGKQCFIELMKTSAFAPMVCNYICRRTYIQNRHFRFEDVLYKDELWTPVILGSAEIVLVTNFDFYYYRPREDSITHNNDPKKRLYALFYIAGWLVNYADGFSFEGEDREFKSWLYVKIFELYFFAFDLLPKYKDSSFNLPPHHLYCWKEINLHLTDLPQKKAAYYYTRATLAIKEYEEWGRSEWVTVMHRQDLEDKDIILIYNKIWGEELTIPLDKIPSNFVITTDRRYFDQAAVVVFHLPELFRNRNGDLTKRDGQIWVAWYLESEENYPWMRESEIVDMFDLRMSYRQDADVVYPYYSYEYAKIFAQPVSVKNKRNKTCMFISSLENKSGRQEYLKELMSYTGIDSYGRLYNNTQLPEDQGIDTKINEYRKYKFVIAFENVIDKDYVTEKFYDPLIAGSVPVYLGAPNIEEFAPGENCFVDVRQFDGPRSLACFINQCYEDELLYAKFFEWRNLPIREVFSQKMWIQKSHPFVRLCEIFRKKY